MDVQIDANKLLSALGPRKHVLLIFAWAVGYLMLDHGASLAQDGHAAGWFLIVFACIFLVSSPFFYQKLAVGYPNSDMEREFAAGAERDLKKHRAEPVQSRRKSKTKDPKARSRTKKRPK